MRKIVFGVGFGGYGHGYGCGMWMVSGVRDAGAQLSYCCFLVVGKEGAGVVGDWYRR